MTNPLAPILRLVRWLRKAHRPRLIVVTNDEGYDSCVGHISHECLDGRVVSTLRRGSFKVRDKDIRVGDEVILHRGTDTLRLTAKEVEVVQVVTVRVVRFDDGKLIGG